MIFKNLTNRFFGRKNRETNESVDEKNLGERITESDSSKETVEQKVNKTKKKRYKYRMTSPNNFKPTKHMKHGTSKLCNTIPDWARNNSKIVIEKLN